MSPFSLEWICLVEVNQDFQIILNSLSFLVKTLN